MLRNWIALSSLSSPESVPPMSDETNDDPLESPADEVQRGFTGSDMLAVLAVSSFLGAIGLTTFYLTTALASR